MDDTIFQKLVEEAVDSLPQEFSKQMDNVAVTFQDFPTVYQVQKSKLLPNTLLFGLYEGVPQTQRGIYYSAVPDKITIFKNAILRVSRTEDDVREKVKQTVIHETGHHFGLSDADMKK